MESTSPDFLRIGVDLKVRKLLGRTYLRDNRLDQAVDVYLGIWQDYPEDVDVLVVFGNLYLLVDKPAAAAVLYRQAQSLAPSNPLVARQLAQAEAEVQAHASNGKPVKIPADLLDREAVGELAVLLRGDEKSAAVRSAADMLEKISAEERGSDANGLPKDEINQLMPALIDLNIRQARAAGKSDLAEALQSLQIKLRKQTGSLRGRGE
jgi:hypothetical protein